MTKLRALLSRALPAIFRSRQIGRGGAVHRPSEEEHRIAAQTHWRERHTIERWALWLTGALALGASVAAGAAIWGLFAAIDAANQAKRQADAAQQQVNVMADQERRQLRAYIVPGSLSPLTGYAAGQKPAVTMLIENMGQTPAYDVTWVAGISPITYPRTKPFVFYAAENPDLPRSSWPECASIVSAPDAHKWFFGKQIPITKTAVAALGPDAIQAIKDKHEALYFAGRICYRDTFGDQHWTDFCWFWAGEGDGLSSVAGCELG